ncbi:MAG: helix-turn-helix domain-containing protein [Ruminococcaceae bacterium]|nr:helix-turn-helix domain-containing protein [Oscillospiraceae bacterium]
MDTTPVQSMKTEFNRDQLLALMKDFHLLTSIRIALFNDEYHEILSYPEHPCTFCRTMKQHAHTRKLCAESDQHSFRQSETEKRLIVYHCHAGLIEATIPLIDNNLILGYLMFGQLSDLSSAQELREMLSSALQSYSLPPLTDPADGIPLKNREHINASAKIMEACTLYALVNQTITLNSKHFTHKLRQYLLTHLGEPLDSHTISSGLGISRSKLYQQCQQYLGIGVAEYLRVLRMEQAQKLLKNTALSVTAISDNVGFTDYNYFCRCFKKETGISPKQYRLLHLPDGKEA